MEMRDFERAFDIFGEAEYYMYKLNKTIKELKEENTNLKEENKLLKQKIKRK